MVRSHNYYMGQALTLAEENLQMGEFPVGCIMVEEGEVVANGRRAHSGLKANEIDHAEVLALRDLVEKRPDMDLGNIVVYSTMEPCLMCFSTMIVNGIRSMVYGYEDVMGGGTSIDLVKLPPFYSSMDLSITPHVLREKCLLLFKKFFENPTNRYLDDSLLARYTMEQELG